MALPEPCDPADLLRHQGFLRRLARGLLRDEHAAEDVVQETFIAALRRRDAGEPPARPWLARVTRNLARNRARSTGRAALRERRAARPEAVPSGEEIHLELEAQRRVSEAVGALREPYRTAIYLRYWRDLGPAEVAERTGVPLATAKTRLRRALVELRAELDRRYGGDRRAWSAALGPAAHALPAAAGPTVLASAPILAGSAALVLVALGAGALHLGAGFGAGAGADRGLTAVTEPGPVLARAADPVGPGSPAHSGPPTSGQPGSARVAVAGESGEREAAPAPALPPAGPSRWIVEGRVVAETGAPVDGAVVGLGGERTTSDEDGVFVLFASRRPSPGASLAAAKDGHAPAISPGFGARFEPEPGSVSGVELQLGARAGWISGLVLDSRGYPAPGWRVDLQDGTAIGTSSSGPVHAEDLSLEHGTRRTTDAEGRFSFESLFPDRSYGVRAWNERTLESVASESVPASTNGLVLRAAGDVRERVEGVVLGMDGSALPGIRVRLSMVEQRAAGTQWMHTGQEARTDADGRFAFRDVPRSEVFLRFDGEGIESTRVDLTPEEPGLALRVEVLRRGRFQFRGEGDAGYEGLAVEDVAGRRLRLSVEAEPGITRGTGVLPLHRGRSQIAAVSELAAHAVLLRDGREAARLPLRIVPGELVHLRP